MFGNIKSRLFFILLAALGLPAASMPPAASLADDAQQALVVGNFSSGGESTLPSGWEPLAFKSIERHTRYRLVQVDNTFALKAESENSASGLVRKIRIDPKRHAILTWKWKVANVLERGDAFQKNGDDFAARLYVTFEYDPDKIRLWERLKYETARLMYGEYPPLFSIIYVWANKTEKGTMVPNPFSDRAVTIVVESGSARLNQWVEVTRDVYKDFEAYFHIKPPMISGVGLMTDSDNTGESATAYYGDIVFLIAR